jgi:aspartyl-tRNA(Asn)/glutamyl-tRNA(Gln) amidotransferase subunit C
MSVQRADVEAVASLARLRLEEGDLEQLTRDLNAILEHVVVLQGLEAEEASDAAGQDELASTRDPEAEEPDALRGGPGAAAPDWRDGFFVVPAPPGVQHGGGE